jgi:TatD DNase family protein
MSLYVGDLKSGIRCPLQNHSFCDHPITGSPDHPMFIDSHCHLEGTKYDADRAEVLKRAIAVGVEVLLAIGNGTGPGTYDCGLRLAEEFAARNPAVPRIYASIGVHPHDAKIGEPAAWAELQRLAAHPRVIAWGEIGLDYWYEFSPREIQQAAFVRQLDLAQEARKPIVIHCRGSRQDREDAWTDLVRLLRQHWAGSGQRGVLHCFSGGPNHLPDALEMGFFVSFAGNVTFPKAEEIREAARQAPLDRILLETDSPYLAPVPHRGRRNEPAYVKEVAHCLAGLRRAPVAEIAAATTANFFRCFGLSG